MYMYTCRCAYLKMSLFVCVLLIISYLRVLDRSILPNIRVHTCTSAYVRNIGPFLVSVDFYDFDVGMKRVQML